MATLTALDRDHAVAGDPGLALTLTGTGFAPGDTARVAGQARDATFVAATTLLAPLLAADLAVAGLLPVAVVGADGNATQARWLPVWGRIPPPDDAPAWLAGALVDDAILLESGDRLLAEDGSALLMEGDTDA